MTESFEGTAGRLIARAEELARERGRDFELGPDPRPPFAPELDDPAIPRVRWYNLPHEVGVGGDLSVVWRADDGLDVPAPRSLVVRRIRHGRVWGWWREPLAWRRVACVAGAAQVVAFHDRVSDMLEDVAGPAASRVALVVPPGWWFGAQALGGDAVLAVLHGAAYGAPEAAQADYHDPHDPKWANNELWGLWRGDGR